MKVYVHYDLTAWTYELRDAINHERYGSFAYRNRAVEFANAQRWAIVRKPRTTRPQPRDGAQGE
jgi:hypothetical protein